MITILGRHGFIGSALAKRFNGVKSYPVKGSLALFHFASPVHPPFEENPEYHMNEILQSFLHLLPYCKENGIYFVYPSSALVYEKDTAFSKTKQIMELMASSYHNTLGLRIFPVYGPGEDRTVISKWCRQMKQGERPTIYGDGKQKRSFIYIDDAIDQIVALSDVRATGIRDIASDQKPVSFNKIVELINKELGTNIKPKYVRSPEGYSKGIVSKKPGKCSVSLKEGIKRICQEI